MFVTTFLRSMPEGAKARRGYERLIGSGSVPGEAVSFSAERGSKERVRSWREAAAVMDLGMASVLRVSEVVQAAHARVCLGGVLAVFGVQGLALYLMFHRAVLLCRRFRDVVSTVRACPTG